MTTRFAPSVGVAAAGAGTTGTVELSEALAAADRALYDAKRAGRNTVVVRSVEPGPDAEHAPAPVAR